MNLPALATAEAQSMAPKTYILGGGANDWMKTATSSILRWPPPRRPCPTRRCPPYRYGLQGRPGPCPRGTPPVPVSLWRRPQATARLGPSASGRVDLPLPVHTLDEDVDGPPARQPDSERLVIRDAVGEQPGLTALYRNHRRLVDRRLHATPAHGPDHLPVLGDCHRCPGSQRPRPLDLYDRGEGSLLSLLAPACDSIYDRVQ